MKSKSRYKNEWKPFKANKRFWKEVLVGRTIQKIEWKGKDLLAFVLDDGQRVFPTARGTKPTLTIID